MYPPISDIRVLSTNAFKDFLSHVHQHRKERTLKKLNEMRAHINSDTRKRHALARSVAEFEHNKREREYTISRGSSYGPDFDRLCTMDGVAKVVVDGNASELRIYTKTLQLIHNPGGRTGPEQHFDIGQKIIVIKLSPKKGDGKNNVHFFDGDYAGEYAHGQAQENNTCFGSNLNSEVDAYIINNEIVPLVHLCLTFLRYEITSPRRRDDFAGPEASISEPAYASDGERSIQREAYIDFMKFVARERLKLVVEMHQSEIQKKEQEIDRLEQKLKGLRTVRNFLEEALRGMEVDRLAIATMADSEIGKLFGEGVKSLKVVEDNEEKKLEVEFMLEVPGRDPEQYALQIAINGSIYLRGPSLLDVRAPKLVDDEDVILPKDVLGATSAALAAFSIPNFFFKVKEYLLASIRGDADQNTEKPGGSDENQ